MLRNHSVGLLRGKRKKEKGQSSPSYLLETPGVAGPPTSNTRVEEHRKKENLRRR
jgi:hypothetical protein